MTWQKDIGSIVVCFVAVVVFFLFSLLSSSSPCTWDEPVWWGIVDAMKELTIFHCLFISNAYTWVIFRSHINLDFRWLTVSQAIQINIIQWLWRKRTITPQCKVTISFRIVKYVQCWGQPQKRWTATKHILKTRKFIDIGHTLDTMWMVKKEKQEMYVVSHQISIFHRSEQQASYGCVKDTKINNVQQRKGNKTISRKTLAIVLVKKNEHVSRRTQFQADSRISFGKQLNPWLCICFAYPRLCVFIVP